MNAGPAATVHARPHNNLARLHALLQQRVHAVFSGVVGVRFPLRAVQRRLVAEISVAPAAVEVVAHQEDVVEILLRRGVIHVFNFVFTGTNGGGQFVRTARFC